MGCFCNRPLSLFYLLCYQQKQAEVKKKQCLKGFSTTKKFQRCNIRRPRMWGRGATSRLFHFDCLSDDPMIRWSNCQVDARWKGHISNCLTMILSLKKHFLKIKNLDISKRINLDLICFWRIKYEKKFFYVQIYAFFSLFSKCRTLEKM